MPVQDEEYWQLFRLLLKTNTCLAKTRLVIKRLVETVNTDPHQYGELARDPNFVEFDNVVLTQLQENIKEMPAVFAVAMRTSARAMKDSGA